MGRIGGDALAFVAIGPGVEEIGPVRRRAGDPDCRRRPRETFANGGGRGHDRVMAGLTDPTTTVAELKARVLAFARERDWEQFHAPKNLSMALAAEAGELMEHFLWSEPDASRAVAHDPAKRGKIAEELADVVIYALEFANVTGLDVAAVIEAKMAANAKKYPVEKARGRADKYTEL
jgi:NTP pyrophosphatase (non-canonical NTP hydrolase)